MVEFSKVVVGVVAAVAVLAVGGKAFAEDGADGEKLFKKYCAACHALPSANANRVGPSLKGIVGRVAGQAPGFTYSIANQQSGITWTEDKLDPYLADPKAVVPGTKMTFAGIKNADERKAVIAYLKAN